jgi:lipopolysaccharide heptosyltransferase II
LKKFLIIQTAFTGDVILATSVIEKLHQHFPDSAIDFLLRKGNESLLEAHPFIHEVIVWDKKQNKLSNLVGIISKVRKSKYDDVINLHRFASSGLITTLSGANEKIGFDKNPLSFFFTKKMKHEIGNGKHEIERNHELIKDLTDDIPAKPKLYPSEKDVESADKIRNHPDSDREEIRNYVCIAPASVWFTKQFPKEKWIELISLLQNDMMVYLIGSKQDFALCDSIKSEIRNRKPEMVVNLAGKLSFLESAALMKGATMNYVNDSAPLHIASSMNAPVTAIFCSTVPSFGFGPLSDQSKVKETKIKLDCKPCGLHGYKACPLGHFKCALTIDVNDILKRNDGRME